MKTLLDLQGVDVDSDVIKINHRDTSQYDPRKGEVL